MPPHQGHTQAENTTIRGLLEDQQNDWDDYVSEQQSCDSMYDLHCVKVLECVVP